MVEVLSTSNIVYAREGGKLIFTYEAASKASEDAPPQIQFIPKLESEWEPFTDPDTGDQFFTFDIDGSTYTYELTAENAEKLDYSGTISCKGQNCVLKQIDYDRVLTYEGESFAVVVVPTDPTNQGRLMLDMAVVAPFRQLNVNVEVAESTWNNVFFNAKLRGAKAYHFNIKNKAELENEALAAKRMNDAHGLQLTYYAKAVELLFGRTCSRILVYSTHAARLFEITTQF